MTFRIPEEYQRKWKSCEVRTDARRRTTTHTDVHPPIHRLTWPVLIGPRGRACMDLRVILWQVEDGVLCIRYEKDEGDEEDDGT